MKLNQVPNGNNMSKMVCAHGVMVRQGFSTSWVLISGPKSPLAHVGEDSSTAHDADGDVAKSQGLKQVQSTKRFRLENLKKCMQ